METAFNDLEIACIVRVFSFLEAKDCARASCVHSLWRNAAKEEALWKDHLARDFAGTSPVNSDGSPAPTYRAAYASMQTAYADVVGPMLTRALACWGTIKTWLAEHSPQILATLNPGASAEQLKDAEQQLGHDLPVAVRCIYRVHNGQDLQLQQRNPDGSPPVNLLRGLFGSLLFYDHVTSNAMLPLSEVVRMTQLFRNVRPMGAHLPLLQAHHVVFAHSFTPHDKVCVLDASTGRVSLKLPPSCPQDWPLAPATDSSPGACDGMLRWMEEYARRLAAGWYGSCTGDSTAQSLADAGVKIDGAISLFPRVFPAAATAITRGVQVTWSSVLVPQESRQGRLMFTYRVNFSLLTPEQEAAAVQRLQQEQQAWQQQQEQQQLLTSSAAAAAGAAAVQQVDSGAGGGDLAAGSSTARGVVPHKQTNAVGPCDASAGSTCVPDVLQAVPSWGSATAVAAAGGGACSSSSGASQHGLVVAPPPAAAAAPAGVVDAMAAIAAGGSSTGSATCGTSGPLRSCQLETRNWRILTAEGAFAETVSGEGVVGLYPLLVPGGDEFAYASCTPLAVRGGREQGEGATSRPGHAAVQDPQNLVGRVLGAMEGSFTFVEGSIMQPMGRVFDVQCPRLVFAVPEYLF